MIVAYVLAAMLPGADKFGVVIADAASPYCDYTRAGALCDWVEDNLPGFSEDTQFISEHLNFA